MKAVFQSYRTGELLVAEVPPPALKPGGVLVRNVASLVSAGTERLMVELARKSLLGKAKERPDLVRQVRDKVGRDGILATIQAVRGRLDDPVPLGYSCAGVVLEVGEGVSDLRSGDAVACAGAGYASHAEVVFVPKNLCVKIPAKPPRAGFGDRLGGVGAEGASGLEVRFEEACFTTLGAVALQGLRLAQVELGEAVAVIGLGLVGILAVQLAKAAGCTVVGMDPKESRCRIAEELGCDAAETEVGAFRTASWALTSGRGADKVIIAASARGPEPVVVAGEVARDKGIVVAVGEVGMEIPRKTYYEKELTFRVSRSYGPGRYDPGYEEEGHDYPVGFVRWTERRNMEAFLQQLSQGKVRVGRLITHRFPVEEAPKAYDLITAKGNEESLGIVLTYPEELSGMDVRGGGSAPGLRAEAGGVAGGSGSRRDVGKAARGGRAVVRIGLIGAGEFARGTLIPAMKRVSGVELVGVCTATGVKARHVADRFGFRYATTEEGGILGDPEIDAVVIATRHHLHARQVIAGLEAGKHVFVEKPLCLSEEELRQIEGVHAGQRVQGQGGPLLMVGYNRRFAPMARSLREFLGHLTGPLVMHYRVNAGYIPLDHWVHDLGQGGGRIIGEVCHFVDFLTFLARALPRRVFARALPNEGRYEDDNVVATLEFANGSLGTITYVAGGDRAFPKERVEVFGGGSTAVLDNFRSLELFRDGRRTKMRSRLGQDKGHRSEWEAFVDAIKSGGQPPIPREEIFSTASATMGIVAATRKGTVVEL